jgi:hypothetical protein
MFEEDGEINKQSKISMWVFCTARPASNRGGQVTITGQAMWVLLHKVALGQFFSWEFGFSFQLSFFQLFHNH